MGSERVCVPGKNRAGVMVVCGNLDREIHKDRGWWVQGLQAQPWKTCCWRQRIWASAVSGWAFTRMKSGGGCEKLFSLPERVMPLGIVALGYAAKRNSANDRYLAGRVHWEQFGAAYTGQAGGPAVL